MDAMVDQGDTSPLINLPGNDIDVKFCAESTATSIKIVWENPDIKFEYFEVKYKEDNLPITKFKTRIAEDNAMTIEELKSNTLYDIRVHTMVGVMPSEYLKRKCRTLKSFSEELKKSLSCTSKPNQIDIYDLKANEHVKSQLKGVRLCEFWHNNDLPLLCDDSEEKTIMFVGATGSGKSTLIDILINYIADVPFADNYRFSLVNESDKCGAEQLHSTTSDITCYKLHYREGLNLNCKILNVIDTPGFNDTRGKSYDREFPKKLKILFTKVIDSVDAICVVLPMSHNKLTDAYMYVLTSIFDLFGKDIKRNIFPFVTFDDGGIINCQHALEEFDVQVESDHYFRFSNSDIFFSNDEQSIPKWKSRRENFNRFFGALSFVQKGSLKESKKVLYTRMTIRIQLMGLQRKLIENVQNINNIRELLTVLRKCRDPDMSDSDTVEELEKVVHHAVSTANCTNCKKCKFTCHKGCHVRFKNLFKVTCTAFTMWPPFLCKVCSGHCESKTHVIEQKEYKYGFVKKSKSIRDVKRNYKIETLDLEQLERIINKEEAGLKVSLSELETIVIHIQTLISKLEEIALHHDKNGVETYLSELINTEVQDQLSGFGDRIKMLNLIIDAVKKGTSVVTIVDQLI